MPTNGAWRGADSGRVNRLTGGKPSQTEPAIDGQLAQVAGRQWGVVSFAQLQALGVTSDEIDGRIARGNLHRLHRGVYAVGHKRMANHAHLIAALLATGPDSFLSHRTAAAVRGLRLVNTREIEVTIPAGRTLRRAGLSVHRTADVLDRDEVSTRVDLRVSSVPRMLIELAPREKPAELDRLVTQAIRKNVLDLDAVWAAVDRHERRPGLAKLRQALHDYRPLPDRSSSLELAFDGLIAGTDIPKPLCNVYIDRWEIDRWWPLQKLAVELDGRPYHVAKQDMERDRIKDAYLLRRGITPLRITDARLEHEPLAALDDVRALLALGG